MIRSLAALGLAGLCLAACNTTPLPPTEVIRYHLGDAASIARGTVAVEPVTGPGVPLPPEFPAYAAAVQEELQRVGYTPAPQDAADFLAIVDLRRTIRPGPPRRSPISIGIGGGGYSGGYHGGVGLGGGVSFPIGGGGRRNLAFTQLGVTIKRRADQTAIWEGHAQGVTDTTGAQATPEGQAHKLAGALFTGFPGESGRTIEVK